MDRREFVEAVIIKGIEAARRDYAHPDKKMKLDGAVAGFEACRGMYKIMDFCEKLQYAHRCRVRSRGKETYWFNVCFHREVEWVCNCLSVILMLDGFPIIIPPTARAVQTVTQILRERK